MPMLIRMTAIPINSGPTAPVNLSAARSMHLKHRNTARVNHIFKSEVEVEVKGHDRPNAQVSLTRNVSKQPKIYTNNRKIVPTTR